jgi:hypothetical protein
MNERETFLKLYADCFRIADAELGGFDSLYWVAGIDQDHSILDYFLNRPLLDDVSLDFLKEKPSNQAADSTDILLCKTKGQKYYIFIVDNPAELFSDTSVEGKIEIKVEDQLLSSLKRII